MNRLALIVASLSLLAPAASFGSLLEGSLSITGTAEVSLGDISFQGGEVTITGQSGDFAGLAGTTASIQDITNPPDATGVLGTPVADFMVFSAASNISFTFTDLLPGSDGAAGCADSPAAAGQFCTPNVPAESPYNLQNLSASSSTASFQIAGFEVDSLTGDTVPFTGTFSQPFDFMSFQDLLSAVEGGQTISTPFSAQFLVQPSVPEPGTAGLLLFGLLPAAWIIRRIRRQA
jgi:hypothetical protein